VFWKVRQKTQKQALQNTWIQYADHPPISYGFSSDENNKPKSISYVLPRMQGIDQNSQRVLSYPLPKDLDVATTCCVLLPNGEHLISGHQDDTLKLWKVDQRQWVLKNTIKQDGILCCAISPNITWLVSGSFDNPLKLWRVDQGQWALKNTVKEEHDGTGITSCAFSPCSTWLVSGGGRDYTLRLWMIDQEQLVLKSTLGKHKTRITSCTFSPDGQYVISGSRDGTIKLWRAAAPKISKHPCVGTFHWHYPIRQILHSPQDNTLTVLDGKDNIGLLTYRVAPSLEAHSKPVVHFRWLGFLLKKQQLTLSCQNLNLEGAKGLSLMPITANLLQQKGALLNKNWHLPTKQQQNQQWQKRDDASSSSEFSP